MFFKVILVFITLEILCCCRSLIETTDETEGSACTWGVYNGTCMNVYKCLTFVLDKKENNHPPICGFQNDVPLICCTACPEEIVANISNAVFNSEAGLMMKNGRKAWDACVEYADKLPYLMKSHTAIDFNKRWNKKRKCHYIEVVARAPAGGEDTKKGEYPFMALLGYGDSLETAQWLCGGSLISKRFILTAGHCISSAQLGPVKYVALGVWKRSEPNELWQRYGVKRIIPHPEYKSPSKYHDIALLETDKPVDFNPGCLPICLHSGNKLEYPVFEGLEFALGWGSLGPGKHLADILQKVNLHNFTDAECAAMYQPHRHLKQGYNSSTQMCYGDYNKPRDTCQGDSGGPLVNAHNEVSFVVPHTVIGVTSYGLPCGYAGGAGMYTRVAHYLPWIERIVWP